MIAKLKSRKLLAALLGVLVNYFGVQLGMAPAVVLNITALLGTYILGQGVADAGAGKSQTTK